MKQLRHRYVGRSDVANHESVTNDVVLRNYFAMLRKMWFCSKFLHLFATDLIQSNHNVMLVHEKNQIFYSRYLRRSEQRVTGSIFADYPLDNTTPKKHRSGGYTVSNLTDQGVEPKPFAPIAMPLTTLPTGRFHKKHVYLHK